MGGLVGFFAGGPARIQALLIGALAMALVCAALLIYGLWWRGEAFEARRDRDVFKMQASVLSDGLTRCNAGADEAKRAGDRAVGLVRGLLEDIRKQNGPLLGQASRIEELLKNPTPNGAGCDAAWDEIEKNRTRASP